MLSTDQLIDLEIAARDALESLEADHSRESAATETDPVAPDNAIGRLSRLDSMQIQQLAKETKRRREQRIEDLHRALDRMDKGKFGRCEQCKGWMDFERLNAQPEARLCSECS